MFILNKFLDLISHVPILYKEGAGLPLTVEQISWSTFQRFTLNNKHDCIKCVEYIKAHYTTCTYMYNLNMNQKCKIRIYIINIYGQCFLCTTSMLHFLFVFPAVITVGIAISIQTYHVTLFIQFRNDHYHVILTAVYRLSPVCTSNDARESFHPAVEFLLCNKWWTSAPSKF